ncbi:MAG: M48 family peptidase [Candidatus Jettenia sp.]|uniref:Peptidase n=1 Tax=Candidatus Jettenia caeni TaxID=247490 RepID=I3IHL0_9BACT|nr:M48 family metallopeptidase [Candidatus Jettenia sp. AMX1]MBC6928528.1 M48 family peptidase [Candidatus Jettenia sp.]WKZ16533.1 MAG: M48 family metallopeptidase [Candidatus Jettenia caeni]KAA0251626.1 MAG: M48 family peptidase [Candidatus Jettenia sp. AMX1]MCE7879798.1 M48 family peptidase [Candidatus Jettenia sp. AMX1]MCQ3925923.1 M48 family peptidase [Candidatus Jettenia sp.]
MLKSKFFISTLAIILFIGCSTVPITGRRQLSFVPQSQLFTLSQDSYHQLLSESKLSNDAGKKEMVVKVGKSIAQSAEQFMRENDMEEEIKNYEWEFNLIEDDKTVNAFCMPGGKIAVYTGILPATQDETGLAVVLGHEVAHAIANHGGERMSQQLLVQLGATGLSVALSQQPAQTQQILLQAYGAGTNIGFILPYSRSHELEADHIGLILMARAGYNPREAIPFWQRMSKMGGERPPEFLSTHPEPERRIEDIKKELPEAMKYYKK